MPTSSFGTLDKRPSGGWRARYTGPDGKRRSRTFDTKTDARVWLTSASADITRKSWRAPEGGKRTVGAYFSEYVVRDDLRASTQALYAGLWKHHLAPTWERTPVAEITPAQVRAWHTAATKTSKPTALAQSYRLLRSVLNVAVGDEVITMNPCRLKSAGTPKAATQARALTASEVREVAGHMPDRYQALVLVLAFGGLRFGEATALVRSDVTADSVRIERSVRLLNGHNEVGPPKTEAGRRTVVLSRFVAEAVTDHMERFVGPGRTDLVFGTSTGTYPAPSNFGETFHRACAAAGLPHVRVHWLRHTGATLAAHTGASTAELMHRLGHASPNAALVYQHAVAERDHEIARALDALAGG